MRHPLQAVRFVRRALVSGSVASLVSTAFIAAASRHETGFAAAGTNAPSQILWGVPQRPRLRFRARWTIPGYLIHHLSAIWWAAAYESPAVRERVPQPLPRALLVMLAAAAFDYGCLPRRLTPGLEGPLSRGAVAGAFAAIGAGLALGSWLQDRPPRLRAATLRRLAGEARR